MQNDDQKLVVLVNSFVINRTPGVFPWSIPLAYFLIVCSAYILKVTTNLLLQIVRDNKIVWRSLLIVDRNLFSWNFVNA